MCVRPRKRTVCERAGRRHVVAGAGNYRADVFFLLDPHRRLSLSSLGADAVRDPFSVESASSQQQSFSSRMPPRHNRESTVSITFGYLLKTIRVGGRRHNNQRRVALTKRVDVRDAQQPVLSVQLQTLIVLAQRGCKIVV